MENPNSTQNCPLDRSAIVTNDYVNISIQKYAGSVKTEIYALNGEFMGVQGGNKLSFKKFKSGIYFCVVSYKDRNKTLRVVKI